MDLTTKTSRQLTALHHGYNADTLVTIAQIEVLNSELAELHPGDPRRGELLNRANILLAEAKTSQAKGRAVFAEIERRTGMDEPLHVDMVCITCRKPAHEVSFGGWSHDSMDDGRECGAYPVKVMVAAGNENVTRDTRTPARQDFHPATDTMNAFLAKQEKKRNA